MVTEGDASKSCAQIGAELCKIRAIVASVLQERESALAYFHHTKGICCKLNYQLKNWPIDLTVILLEQNKVAIRVRYLEKMIVEIGRELRGRSRRVVP